MDDLITVLELLREKHRFTGYVHVKMVPGAETAQIERLTSLASRVSLNLEAPCGENLVRIAPEKSLETAMAGLDRVRSLVVRQRAETGAGRPVDTLHPGGASGMTFQFVVGATPDSDRAILGKVTELYAGGGVHHAHFSAFRPIRETPMEETPAAPALREVRLYQTDYLLRRYGFERDEVVYDGGGTSRWPTIPRPPGRWPTRSSFRWRCGRHPTRCWCASPASGPGRRRRSWRSAAGPSSARWRTCGGWG
jgi:predicted DNA-binding helix-hairpin-helix protein